MQHIRLAAPGHADVDTRGAGRVCEDGSILANRDPTLMPVTEGDAVMVGPAASFGYQPEGKATITALLIYADYLIDHLFWQYFDLFPDHDAARDLATKLFTTPVHLLHLGERKVQQLVPILDELAARTLTAQDTAGYFRSHSLVLSALEVVSLHVHRAPVPVLASRERASGPVSPRWIGFRQIRQGATPAAALMHGNMARRWRVEDVAVHACFSVSQFTRVCRASFGVSPMTCLSILRVRGMARLIREMSDPIAAISERVDWARHDGQASRVFRRYMGTSPRNYRHHGPPIASTDGPGIAVAQAAKSAIESAK